MTTIQGSRAEINVTPMIDVLLVLLIIFLVIMPQHSTGLNAQAPSPAAAIAVPRYVEPSQIVVSVAENRRLSINRQPVQWDDLDSRLKQIFTQRPDSTLFVAGAPQVEFQDVAYVIDTARGAGIHRVGLMPRDK